MRQIKFRAWDKKIGGWQSPQNIAIGGDGQPYWLFGYSAEVVLREDWAIMQFTGLQDKNGKEIWEWDIITWGGINCVVRYGTIFTDGGEKEATGWVASDENCVSMSDDCFVDKDCEVLGNIYENPDILERIK